LDTSRIVFELVWRFGTSRQRILPPWMVLGERPRLRLGTPEWDLTRYTTESLGPPADLLDSPEILR